MENTNNIKESLLKLAHGFEAKLILFFAKFPHIPEGGRKVIADIVPWLALIFGILSLLGLLGVGAFTTLLMILVATPTLLTEGIWVIVKFITTLLGLAAVILQFLAVSPLRARMKKGWNYLFYGILIGVLSTIISVIGGVVGALVYAGGGAVSSLVSGALSFLIGGWILFEIRDQYKA